MVADKVVIAANRGVIAGDKAVIGAIAVNRWVIVGDKIAIASNRVVIVNDKVIIAVDMLVISDGGTISNCWLNSYYQSDNGAINPWSPII